ncbi:MAG TPA: MFS transporter [Candidatus Dormibacteraeota bacterium]|nr:MFS transporter [Candidatus Dormibacteraeota bacterium]
MSAPAKSVTRWALVFWLFILSAVAFLDRTNISIAGSSIAKEFHLTSVQLGWVFSAFLVGYALFQTPGGWLADRFGPRLVLAAGVVWWGVFTALTATVSSTAASAIFVFIAVRFMLGAGEAIIYPASNQFVSKWIPTQERGIANGLIFAGVGVGAGITPILVTSIILRYGWRASFWMSAGLGLVAGAVWFLIARDTPEAHPAVSAEELAYIRAGRTVPVSASSVSSKKMPSPWSSILGSKEVQAVTFSYFCFGYVAWIFFSWFYIYLSTVRHLDLKTSAFYSTLPPVAMAICSPLGGVCCDALTRAYGKRMGRTAIPVFALALTAMLLISGSRAQSARFASVVLAGGAGALYLSQSSFWSVTADISAGFSGTVSGFMNMGAQFGGAVTASLTPWIASRYGWTSSFYTAAVLALLGALAWLFVNPNRAVVPSSASGGTQLP